MRIIYIGSGKFGLDSLDAIHKSDHELCFVVTQPAHPAGRGKKLRPTPVAEWAVENAVPFAELQCASAPENIEHLSTFAPDLIVVIAFGQIIRPKLTDLPPKGTINVHSSLLPKYRGAAPINWAIINGEAQTGVSIITVTQQVDAGDILETAATDIVAGENADQLHDRLAKLAAPLLVQTINKIADETATYTPQDHSRATAAPKLDKQAGFLDFAASATTIERRIRGLWPWPCACAIHESKKTGKSVRVALEHAQIIEKPQSNLPPGTVDDDLDVICGQNALRITKIKPAGGRLMQFKDFVNGHQVRPGDIFTQINYRKT